MERLTRALAEAQIAALGGDPSEIDWSDLDTDIEAELLAGRGHGGEPGHGGVDAGLDGVAHRFAAQVAVDGAGITEGLDGEASHVVGAVGGHGSNHTGRAPTVSGTHHARLTFRHGQATMPPRRQAVRRTGAMESNRRTPGDTAFQDRAWLAWHSMPRGAKGKPPSWRSIELEHKLAEGTFSKLFKGHRTEQGMPMLARIARALHVDVVWLVHGIGDPPTPSGPVPPRGQTDSTPGAERALELFRRALRRSSVSPRRTNAAVACAAVALGVSQDAVAEDAAREIAAQFARANGLPRDAIERAVSLPAPPSWTAEQWYTRIKAIAAEHV